MCGACKYFEKGIHSAAMKALIGALNEIEWDPNCCTVKKNCKLGKPDHTGMHGSYGFFLLLTILVKGSSSASISLSKIKKRFLFNLIKN